MDSSRILKTPKLERTDMRARVCMFAMAMFVGLNLLGCGGTGSVVSENPSQSLTWLASEIDTKYVDDFAFEFPVRNGMSRRVEFRVRSIGCSCNQIRHENTQLKVGSTFSIEPHRQAVLKLRPPTPSAGDSRTYSFSVEVVDSPGKSPAVLQFDAMLRVVRNIQLSSQVILQEFTDDIASQKARLEVTRHTRNRGDLEEALQITGWPQGSIAESIEPIGPAVEADGIWRRSYRSEVTVPRPDFSQGDVRSLLTVRGTAEHPRSEFQLVQRSRSGIAGPKLVHFGETKVGVPASRRIQFVAHDDLPFVIQGQTSNETIAINPDLKSPQPRHWVQLTWTAKEPGELRQKLQVTTDHPRKPSVEIEIRGSAIP